MSYEKLNLSNGGKFSAEHVSHIEDGIIQNALDLKTKQDKGDYLTPESTIPSEKIVEDETHRFTTDSEKASWSSKADGAHGHAISDVEGLQTALDGKAESNHSHDESYYSKISADELLSRKAEKVHSHEISGVNGLSDELIGLENSIKGKADTTHYHSINEVNGLNEALTKKAEKVHGHVVSDVDGLQSALDGKSDVGHRHSIDDVTGLQSALDGKSGTDHNHDGVYSPVSHNHDTVYAPLVHTHVSADITDLESYVDGRIGVVAGSALDDINGEVI